MAFIESQQQTAFNAIFGLSVEEFSEAIANKIARKVGIPQTVADNRKPIRGIRNLAREFGSSTATFQRMINDGRLPYRKIGNRYIFDIDEVNRALAVNTL